MKIHRRTLAQRLLVMAEDFLSAMVAVVRLTFDRAVKAFQTLYASFRRKS